MDKYKDNITTSFRNAFLNGECDHERKYQDWMIANPEDGNINMQSLNLVRQQKDYEKYTKEEFCYNVAHDFTHICQQKN